MWPYVEFSLDVGVKQIYSYSAYSLNSNPIVFGNVL
jgi:hypothetical protein